MFTGSTWNRLTENDNPARHVNIQWVWTWWTSVLRAHTPFILTLTHRDMHDFGLWEESVEPGEKPQRHRQNPLCLSASLQKKQVTRWMLLCSLTMTHSNPESVSLCHASFNPPWVNRCFASPVLGQATENCESCQCFQKKKTPVRVIPQVKFIGNRWQDHNWKGKDILERFSRCNWFHCFYLLSTGALLSWKQVKGIFLGREYIKDLHISKEASSNIFLMNAWFYPVSIDWCVFCFAVEMFSIFLFFFAFRLMMFSWAWLEAGLRYYTMIKPG